MCARDLEIVDCREFVRRFDRYDADVLCGKRRERRVRRAVPAATNRSPENGMHRRRAPRLIGVCPHQLMKGTVLTEQRRAGRRAGQTDPEASGHSRQRPNRDIVVQNFTPPDSVLRWCSDRPVHAIYFTLDRCSQSGSWYGQLPACRSSPPEGRYREGPPLIVNSEKLDFVDNPHHLDLLVERIEKMRGGREFFNRA